MKIERNVNGRLMEFKLTPDELYKAYVEQQHELDITDIDDLLQNYRCKGGAEDFFEAYGVPFERVDGNEALISEMATEKRHNMDKHDMAWDTARDEAISEILDRYHDELFDEQVKVPTVPQLYPGLPESCFSVSEATGELVIILRGEMGYGKTPWNSNDIAKNRELAENHNAEMGISKAQVAAMVAGSLFGWHVPGANPEAYDENGNPKRPSLDEQISICTLAATEQNGSDRKPEKGQER